MDDLFVSFKQLMVLKYCKKASENLFASSQTISQFVLWVKGMRCASYKVVGQ